MQIAPLFCLNIILAIFPLISSNKFRLTSNPQEEYIFNDFSNTNCDSNFTTSFTTKTCSSSLIVSDLSFSFTLKDTNSLSHKVKCAINSNSKMRYLEQTDIEYTTDTEYGESSDLPTKDNCYKTLCEFDRMIKENFTILINNDTEIKVDGLPDNIYLSTYFYENVILEVNKCYLVKNIFKQVSKYRIDSDNDKITFLFISSIKAKVEKEEKIEVEVFLQKDGNLEKKIINCLSEYEAEPLKKNEEILAFYDCEIPDLDNIEKYNGLIFNNSLDIRDIPKDSISNNPKITDELIKNGTINDYSVVSFNSNNILFDDCQKSGSFKIIGNINGNLEEINDFGLILYLNNSDNFVTAMCNIPSGYRQELTISCKVQDNFFNSRINIPTIQILNYLNDTLIQINEISKNELSTCIINPIPTTVMITPTTTLIPTTILITTPTTQIIRTEIETTETKIEPVIIPGMITNVVFRQINNLEINNENNYIKFNIIGFAFENNLEKDMKLPINVDLVNNDGNKENINLNCSLNDIINSTTENAYSLIFNCLIDNVNDTNNIKDIILTTSSSLINTPIEDPNLSSASSTDQLILRGSLKNFSNPDNLLEIPPILSSSSITGENCRNKGIFEINGILDKSIDTDLSFYLKLPNQNINVRCKISKAQANSEVNLICNTLENINNEQIYINSKIIYDIDYKELFYINEVQSSYNIYCANNDQLTFQKAQKKMESFVSFRQVSKFRKLDKRYLFFLASFIKKEIDFSTKIHFVVEIKSSTSTQQKVKLSNKNKGRLLYFRKLSRREEQSVECTVRSKTSINQDGLGAAGWDCTTGESSISDATGLDILESDDVTGIPDDPNLIDPAIVDVSIENGTATDYSIEENLNVLLPLFNTLDLNFSLCRQNGSFSLVGNTTSTIENDVVFNLSLSYPSVIFACKLPRVLKGQITEIECYSKEEFYNNTVFIEETVIRYDNKEYFILRNTSSGDRYVTCSSSNSSVEANTYNEGFSTISKRYNNGSGAGLGTAGIVIIIIFGVIILAGITILIILIKSNKANKVNEDTTESRNIGNSSSSYY